MNKRGFCIFIDTFFQGRIPSCYEGSGNEPQKICIFATEREAQLEIVDFMEIRLQEFIDGERDFDDATTVEEYVIEVEVLSDGSIRDLDGNFIQQAE